MVVFSLRYMASGIALCVILIGILWGIQYFKMAILALFPFGSNVESDWPNSHPTSNVNLVLNIIWLIFGGLWIVLVHLTFGIFLCLSIIGIPFGLQHFKLMKLAFSTFGRYVRDV